MKLLTWFLFILFHNYVDYRIRKQGKKPPYFFVYTPMRIAGGFFHALWILDISQHCTQSWSCLLFALAPLVIYQACTFWLVYDIVCNWWTKKPLLYRDQIEKDSGWIERLLVGKTSVYVALKITAFVLAILSSIVIYYQYEN